MAEEIIQENLENPKPANFYSYFDGSNTNFAKAMSGFRSYQNVDPPISSNPEFNFEQYGFFRPNEVLPTTQRGIMVKVEKIYKECNIVRNIIDLMDDFTSKGVKISHPYKSRDKVYKEWREKINKNGDVFSKIANAFYKTGNVFIQRTMGTIIIKRNGEEIKKTIPVKYTLINPAIVNADDPELNAFIGEHKYYIDLAHAPKDVLTKLGLGSGVKHYLTPKNYAFLFYKKNDWDSFATPITYGMIKDATMLDKLDLADRTALDSAINHIRIYRLGSLEHKILPEAGAFDQLDKMLQANKGSGCTNILWGPDIELVESASTFYQFLGWDKYEPAMEKLYQGAGIRTSKGNSSGTSSFLSLNVILERMAYGRDALDAFIKGELDFIREALGDTIPAEVEYQIPNLTDENAYRALLIQLADRNLASDEIIQESFNHNPTMEAVRIKRNESDRDASKRPRKVGPYSDKDFEKSLVKIAMTSKLLDMDSLSEQYPGLSEFDFLDPEMNQESGQPQQGRPMNSKDSEKRQRRSFKPVKSTAVEIWAAGVYDLITNAIKPGILQTFQKANLRALTAAEFKEYEDLKTGILFNMEYGSNDIAEAISKPIDIHKINHYKKWVSKISEDLKRELTTNEKIRVQAVVYAQFI